MGSRVWGSYGLELRDGFGFSGLVSGYGFPMGWVFGLVIVIRLTSLSGKFVCGYL